MNYLITEKENERNRRRLLKKDLVICKLQMEELQSEISAKEIAISELENLDNSQLLFHFCSLQKYPKPDEEVLYFNYYYDYVTGSITRNIRKYPNSINVCEHFKEIEEQEKNNNYNTTLNEETLNLIIRVIDNFVNNLINEYDITTWEDLNKLIINAVNNKASLKLTK